MVRLPNPETDIQRVTPTAQRGVASYRPGMVESASAELGQTIARLAQQESDHIAKVQAQDAINKLRQKQLDLTSGDPVDKTKGTGGGYVHVRGSHVVNTPVGGKAFLDTYREQFKKASDEIAGGLHGAAREAYDQAAHNVYLDFQTGLVRHSLQESEAFDKETLNGTLMAETGAAGAKWDDPLALAVARTNILNAVNERISREGTAPEAADAARRKALSDMHQSVVNGALANWDAEYADKYIKANKEDFSAEGLLQATTKVHALRKQVVAAAAVQSVDKRIATAVMPTDFDRLVGQQALVESHARQVDSQGRTVVSPAGAVGIMQIMPTTGPEAAKLAGVEWDEKKLYNDKEYNMLLGKAYMAEMLRQFDGDTRKALAAYNAGAGNVRKAVKAADKFNKIAQTDPNIKAVDWVDLLPKPEETKPYIEKIMQGYVAGVAPAEPNVMDVRRMAAEEVLKQMPDATSDVIEAAQTKAEQSFNDMRTARNQDRDNMAEDIMARIDAGQITAYTDLSPAELAVLGDKRDNIRKYITAAVDERAEADPVVVAQYQELSLNPQRLMAMSIPEIMAMSPDIGRKNAGKLVEKRAEYLRKPEAAVTVDADMFRNVARAYGVTNKEELVALKDRTDDAINAAQQASGRGLTREEKRDIIKNLALEVPVPGRFWGTRERRVYQITDPTTIVIPPAYREKIKQRAAELGVTIRTDDQWRDALRAILQEEKEAELAKG